MPVSTLLKISLFVFLGSLLPLQNSMADDLSVDIHNIQYKRLVEPTASQSNNEKHGKVYLYIGMKDKEVDQAFDEQFNRIENFMFSSVISTDKEGKALKDKHGKLVLESDDC